MNTVSPTPIPPTPIDSPNKNVDSIRITLTKGVHLDTRIQVVRLVLLSSWAIILVLLCVLSWTVLLGGDNALNQFTRLNSNDQQIMLASERARQAIGEYEAAILLSAPTPKPYWPDESFVALESMAGIRRSLSEDRNTLEANCIELLAGNLSPEQMNTHLHGLNNDEQISNIREMRDRINEAGAKHEALFMHKAELQTRVAELLTNMTDWNAKLTAADFEPLSFVQNPAALKTTLRRLHAQSIAAAVSLESLNERIQRCNDVSALDPLRLEFENSKAAEHDGAWNSQRAELAYADFLLNKKQDKALEQMAQARHQDVKMKLDSWAAQLSPISTVLSENRPMLDDNATLKLRSAVDEAVEVLSIWSSRWSEMDDQLRLHPLTSDEARDELLTRWNVSAFNEDCNNAESAFARFDQARIASLTADRRDRREATESLQLRIGTISDTLVRHLIKTRLNSVSRSEAFLRKVEEVNELRKPLRSLKNRCVAALRELSIVDPLTHERIAVMQREFATLEKSLEAFDSSWSLSASDLVAQAEAVAQSEYVAWVETRDALQWASDRTLWYWGYDIRKKTHRWATTDVQQNWSVAYGLEGNSPELMALISVPVWWAAKGAGQALFEYSVPSSLQDYHTERIVWQDSAVYPQSMNGNGSNPQILEQTSADEFRSMMRRLNPKLKSLGESDFVVRVETDWHASSTESYKADLGRGIGLSVEVPTISPTEFGDLVDKSFQLEIDNFVLLASTKINGGRK